MTGQELWQKTLGVLKQKAKETILQLNDEIIPDAMGYAADVIPGPFDNMAIAAAKPVVHSVIKGLAERL